MSSINVHHNPKSATTSGCCLQLYTSENYFIERLGLKRFLVDVGENNSRDTYACISRHKKTNFINLV